MTRCYEYYCLFQRAPERCVLSVRGQHYVKQYIQFMTAKGIKFDGSAEDKEEFLKKVDEFGVERVVTQPKKVQHVALQKTVRERPRDWTLREQLQRPQSRMELAVVAELNSRGFHPELGPGIGVQSTRPDLYFPDRKIAVFLDGFEAHKRREPIDYELRERLRTQHGVTVVEFSYSDYSKATEKRIVDGLLDLLQK